MTKNNSMFAYCVKVNTTCALDAIHVNTWDQPRNEQSILGEAIPPQLSAQVGDGIQTWHQWY